MASRRGRSLQSTGFRRHVEGMLAGGIATMNEEAVPVPDGRQALLDTSKCPLRDDAGAVIGMVGVCREIAAPRR